MGVPRDLATRTRGWLAACSALLICTTAQAAPQTVTAVFDIEAQGLSLKKTTINGLSDFLAASLASTGEHQVVPRDELEKRLREQKAASYKQCYDESCQIEIGKELAADHALATKIVKLGAQCIVTMKLFELRRSTTAWAATARGGCTEDALLGSIEKALSSRTGARRPQETAKNPQPSEESKDQPKDQPKQPPKTDAVCSRYQKHGLSGRADLKALPVITAAVPLVEKSYFEPARIDYRGMLHASLSEVARCVPGVSLEDRSADLAVVIGGQKLPVAVGAASSSWKLQSELRRVLGWVGGNVAADVDQKMIEYAALSGALSTLDNHTVIFTPREYSEMKVNTTGSFGGVGMVLSMREGRLSVMSTIEGSPAHRAELQAGDVITAIDARPTEGVPLDECVRLLRGDVGTQLRITVDRGGQTFDRTLRREQIKVPATRHERLGGNLGYVKIHQLGPRAADELQAALTALGSIEGLIIDLRNNPGGFLKQAVAVTDQFVASGLLVGTAGANNTKREDHNATAAGTNTKLPIVVLVNKGTASGAEIVAGALKLHDRALVIGETTFGKATVQVMYDLPDGSALRLTIAQYVMTGDHKFADRGFTPDVHLKDTKIADKTAEDATIALAARFLRAAPSPNRTQMLEAARRLPRDALVERFE